MTEQLSIMDGTRLRPGQLMKALDLWVDAPYKDRVDVMGKPH
ncbi:MAG: hypothetical protein ACTSPR_09320 [Candidatus Thorarchaeota archaeon]